MVLTIAHGGATHESLTATTIKAKKRFTHGGAELQVIGMGTVLTIHTLVAHFYATAKKEVHRIFGIHAPIAVMHIFTVNQGARHITIAIFGAVNREF